MKIAVIGPGAMGLLFGGYLSKKHDVTLIGRNAEKMKKISISGVSITEQNEDGEKNTYHPKALADSGELSPFELVILFVKSGNSEEALESNRHLIDENTLLMTLQNGAGHDEILCRYAKKENIIIGTTQQGSYLIDDISICHSGGGNTALGALGGGSGRFEPIAEAFRECGFPCEVTDQIQKMVWNKLMINASSSVLSGLLQTTQGYVAENPQAWSTAKNLIREMCTVASAQGYSFDADEQISRIEAHLKNAPGGYTSIYADLKAGRTTEVRKINGAVVDAADKLNIPVPTHKTILNLVLAMEQKNGFAG